ATARVPPTRNTYLPSGFRISLLENSGGQSHEAPGALRQADAERIGVVLGLVFGDFGEAVAFESVDELEQPWHVGIFEAGFDGGSNVLRGEPFAFMVAEGIDDAAPE